MENALTRAETLRGMTIWAILISKKKKKGSFEVCGLIL
jgi:hypothetical protein